jgi:hypothetical protein
MKNLVVVFLCVVCFISSCASFPKTSPENVEFQNITGIDLAIVKRGLYSIAHEYKDAASQEIYDKLLKNIVTLKVDENQSELVKYVSETSLSTMPVNGTELVLEKTNLFVTINGYYKDFSDIEKCVLLVGILSTVGLMNSPEAQAPDAAYINRFYESINMYLESGYDVSGLVNDEFYRDKKVAVVDGGIM